MAVVRLFKRFKYSISNNFFLCSVDYKNLLNYLQDLLVRNYFCRWGKFLKSFETLCKIKTILQRDETEFCFHQTMFSFFSNSNNNNKILLSRYVIHHHLVQLWFAPSVPLFGAPAQQKKVRPTLYMSVTILKL